VQRVVVAHIIFVQGGEINKIHLESLSLNNVNRFIGDSINIENYDQCRDLAAVVHLKTGFTFHSSRMISSPYNDLFQVDSHSLLISS